ncbi:MAG: circularly permuted type 2 ATP-grasp protein, partial [Jatrophihabitans sp.]|uniref:circularly permuted type 2 ATP-grasp protein n=1 Tax=Jatrophihabitans sp. TaxID=1932789 RepID=UPI003F7DF582
RVRLRPVSHYPQRLLAALRAAAPPGVVDPNVVVLTPGVYNSAYFEHAWLARAMGVELVEGRDLVSAGGVVRMRDTSGERRVDVIYRRVDDEYLDPVQFRADSMLGCPGLLTAARAGNVTIANAVGNGVADDKLIYTYLPDLVRYYLHEEPVLPNVDTWRLEDPGALEEVLDRLDELVVKPVDGAGGRGLVIGPQASRQELDALRARLIDDPRGWIAQPVVQLSTVPTLVGNKVAPRHVDLRPFAVNDGDDVWVLPGGLTRVALPEGSLVVNSSQGGGSKDTWVLSGARKPTPPPIKAAPPFAYAPLPAVDRSDDGGYQQQQQQQQQQGTSC